VAVVDHAVPAAHCLPGHNGRGLIVLTSATLANLTTTEVGAAPEHERAHFYLHHHRMILIADSVATILAWTGALRSYPAQVRRIVEMEADDVAVRRFGTPTVASTLLAMRTRPPRTACDARGLSFAGSAVTARIRRLIDSDGGTRRLRTTFRVLLTWSVLLGCSCRRDRSLAGRIPAGQRSLTFSRRVALAQLRYYLRMCAHKEELRHVVLPDDAQVDLAVEVFRMLADATRVKLLWVLLPGEASVNQLAEAVAKPQTAVSQHLAKLRMAHLVQTRRQGTQVFYRVASDHVRQLVEDAIFHADHAGGGLPRHHANDPAHARSTAATPSRRLP